jgi:UPF0042 nucleotide-binding protein
MHIIVITGLSGAGKSIALNILEDLGFYCIDNLPATLLADLINSFAQEQQTHLAVAIDARNEASIAVLPEIVQSLKQRHKVEMLFLSADNQTLMQRFSETRRRHPLSARFSAGVAHTYASTTLVEAIELERRILLPLMQFAHTIDTTKLYPHTLKVWIRNFVQHQHTGLTLLFESFGFKHGIPNDADFVFDVRSLPNPYYDPALRTLTGLDAPVSDFLSSQPTVLAMADDIRHFIEKWLLSFVMDNRSYLTIALGCTGGQHRSVFLVQKLAHYFSSHGTVLIRHREISEEVKLTHGYV